MADTGAGAGELVTAEPHTGGSHTGGSLDDEVGSEALDQDHIEIDADELGLASGESAAGESPGDEVLGSGSAESELLKSGCEGGSGDEISVEQFTELRLERDLAEAANEAWSSFLEASESHEAAGEAIYGALIEGAPSLAPLFTTPRAVQAMKFMYGLHGFVTSLGTPDQLKIAVESLAFGHLHLDVNIPRVQLFRDALLDLFDMELGDKFTPLARQGWMKLFNYVGGAIIFVKVHYAERITMLLSSWQYVNSGNSARDNDKPPPTGSMDMNPKAQTSKDDLSLSPNANSRNSLRSRRSKKEKIAESTESRRDSLDPVTGLGKIGQAQVPTTYNAMFRFNAAVMGFSHNIWTMEVLACFDSIVKNVSNSRRLQEECDVLVLRISKVSKGTPNFSEYKSCMLASLRSLLPKDWSSKHEVAWTWLWENVERLMVKNVGAPPKWEAALEKMLGSLDDQAAYEVRKEIYAKFFTLAPAGQDYFKQSDTYLHFIAERIISFTLELYRNPVKMVDDISALGLRHVGYAIPTELFSPFVSVCVEVLQGKFPNDTVGIEAFRWSIALIAKMLTRIILEGSTIVMKAINANSTVAIRRAVSCAPRADRCSWMLLIQVGTQSISPLAWAIQSGALDASRAMLEDMFTIRADRDRYYFGADELFQRHPDIVKKLCDSAPSLLPVLLDGLVWRSRSTENGHRRVNYYLKNLLIGPEGAMSPSMSWIAKAKDPKLVCHPIMVLLSDTVWSRVACRAFMWRKTWFLLTLLMFIGGHSVLRHLHSDELTRSLPERTMIFAFRVFIYCCSMTQLLFSHISRTVKAYHRKDVHTHQGWLKVPAYLHAWQEMAGLILTICLVVMLGLEPLLWCMKDPNNKIFIEECATADPFLYTYSIFSMLAMVLYYSLLVDLAVLSTKVSAYVLVCIRMLPEVWMFILALTGTMLAFASGLSTLDHNHAHLRIIPSAMLRLMQMVGGMKNGDDYEAYIDDPIVFTAAYIFLVITTIFFINMLTAQVTCAYENIYIDMVGYARLERVEIIVATMPSVSAKRWADFVKGCRFGDKLEFNSGDVGLPGGFQILEASSLHPTSTDTIRRFGGSTAPTQAWPVEEEKNNGGTKVRVDRLEKILQKGLKRSNKTVKRGETSGASITNQNSNLDQGAGDDSKSYTASQSSQGDDDD